MTSSVISCYSLLCSAATLSAPPDRRGQQASRVAAALVWVGDLVWWKWHGVTETTMFKGPLPVPLKRRLWSLCFCAVTAQHHYLSAGGHSDVMSPPWVYLKRLVGGVKTTWGTSVTDITVIAEIFIAHRKNEKQEQNTEWNKLQRERQLAWGNKLCIPAYYKTKAWAR